MHPEIKKFYEQKDHRVDYWEPTYSVYALEDAKGYWLAGDLIVGCYLNNGTNLYYFNGKKYSEGIMLRMVRLKAFL